MRTAIRTMIILSAIGLYLGLAQPAVAAYLGGITLDKDSGSVLPYGEQVLVSYDYKVDAPEGALIFAHPSSSGSLTPGSVTQGGHVVAQGSGSNSGWFSVNFGDAIVTHVRVYMTSLDQSEIYLDIKVPVKLNFVPHAIFNIEMNHGQYSRLPYGRSLVMNFDYSSNLGVGLKIYARPFTNGTLTPGYGASGSGVLPSSGSFSQNFFFTGDADITDIRFQIYDESSNLLAEQFVPFEAHWRQIGIYNITTDWVDGDCLHNSQNLTVSFTMEHTETDAVHVWATGTLLGEKPIAMDGQFSGIIPTGPQVISRYFFLANGESDIDGVKLIAYVDGHPFMEFIIPADFHYAPHAIQNPVFSPASPAILTNGENLSMTYDYITDNEESLRIYTRATYNEESLSGYYNNGSPAYYPPSGSGSFFLGFFSGEHQANGMRFQMQGGDPVEVFYEQFVPGSWAFGTSAITAAPQPVSASMAVLNPIFPNPFNPTTTVPVLLDRDAHVQLKVYDVRGLLVETLQDGDLAAGLHSFTFRGEAQPSGVYYCRMKTLDGVQTRAMTLVK